MNKTELTQLIGKKNEEIELRKIILLIRTTRMKKNKIQMLKILKIDPSINPSRTISK